MVAACAKAGWLMLILAGQTAGSAIANWIEIAGIVVGTIGFFGYMRDLALRVPSDRIAGAARVVQWITGIGLTLCAGLGLWVQIAQPRPSSMPRRS